MKKAAKKKSITLAERLEKLERIVKRQEQRIKELEREIKRIDIDEVTEISSLNKSANID